MEMLYTFTVQYWSHKSHAAMEQLSMASVTE